MIHTDERCNTKIKQGGIYIDPITNGIRKLLSGYARIFNAQYQQTGSLFRQKTKAKCLSEIEIIPGTKPHVQDYYINCFHYIHQNPVVAKLVNRLEDWQFSSFREYAGLGGYPICEKNLAATYCNYNPVTFIKQSYELVDKKLVDLFT